MRKRQHDGPVDAQGFPVPLAVFAPQSGAAPPPPGAAPPQSGAGAPQSGAAPPPPSGTPPPPGAAPAQSGAGAAQASAGDQQPSTDEQPPSADDLERKLRRVILNSLRDMDDASLAAFMQTPEGQRVDTLVRYYAAHHVGSSRQQKAAGILQRVRPNAAQR